MPASGVVEVDDPGRDLQACLGSGAEPVPVDVLHLDGRVEGFTGRVVQGRADPAHRLQDPEPTAGCLVRLGAVLPGFNRSLWKITPSTVPPRLAEAIESEATARSAS